MSFRTFFLELDEAARKRFAERAGSSAGYLALVAYGHKRVELGMADVLVALGEGKFSLGDLPLTERAKAQHAIRNAPQEAA